MVFTTRCSATNVQAHNAAPEWQAGSLWRQSRELPVLDHSRGLLGAKVGQNGAIASMQEKLVDRRAERIVVVVDESKLVERLNLAFLLPKVVLPGAWRQMLGQLEGAKAAERGA
jgi:hypothetical protein